MISNHNTLPKVSCCLCTYDRLKLAQKSIECFLNQTYPNKELIIVSEGPKAFKDNLSLFLYELNNPPNIKVIFLDGQFTLGAIRNISIKNASGDLYCQWDDDDFNHPKRLATQIGFMLKERAQASFLKDQLHYYWESKELYWEKWNYKNCPDRCSWIPGTIIMRIDPRFSYPETGNVAKAGEDVVLVDQLWHKYVHEDYRIACLEDKGYMHVYSYHGAVCNHKNTFNQDHHMYLSKNKSFLTEDMQEKEHLISDALDQNNLDDEIKVMGRNGLAFRYLRNR